MASRLETLRKVLSGTKGRWKNPTERPGIRSQRRVFDSFSRAATSLYNQALAGGVERKERVKDYEEMDQSPEVSQALNIYADDSCTFSELDEILRIESDNERIQRELEELFFERLDIEFHLWQWIRNMVKYGDHFNLLDIVEKEGVLGTISLPVVELEREEGFDGDPNSLRFRWTAQGNTTFESFQISHMRILGDDRFLPYGRSVLDPARKIWKQLQLGEDAMMIYRIVRAPERRVFYVDVANIPPNDVEQYILSSRDALKRTPLITESTGQIDYRFNPMSIDEDFFLPVRGDRGSRIETLPGGTNQGDIDDIQYIQQKMFIALGVPKSYLQSEEDLGGKGTLAQEDIKFARTIQRIQKIVVSELGKIALIHLHLRGFQEEDLYNFNLKLTNPSTVMEMMQLDLIEKRFNLAVQMSESTLIDDTKIKKDTLKFSDHEIQEIDAALYRDARKKYLLNQLLENGQESPAADEFGNEQEGGEQEQSQDSEPQSETKPSEETGKGTGGNPMLVPDPAGTRTIPGMKDISNYDNSLRKPQKSKKKRRDAFSNGISDGIHEAEVNGDTFKYNRDIELMLESMEANDKIPKDRFMYKEPRYSKTYN